MSESESPNGLMGFPRARKLRRVSDVLGNHTQVIENSPDVEKVLAGSGPDYLARARQRGREQPVRRLARVEEEVRPTWVESPFRPVGEMTRMPDPPEISWTQGDEPTATAEEAQRWTDEERPHWSEADAARWAREEEEARLAAQAEVARLARAEEERRVREQAESVAREREQARLAREAEVTRLTREAEAARLARAEETRLAQEEASRLAKEEEARRIREQAEYVAREEAARLARQAEEARLAQEEEARKSREAELVRLARLEEAQAARNELARLAREKEARFAQLEEARLAREEADRLAREAEEARLAREEEAQVAREDAARLAREEAERLAREEAVRSAHEEAAQLAREADRLAREEAARSAREEAARLAREAEAARAAQAATRFAQAAAARASAPEVSAVTTVALVPPADTAEALRDTARIVLPEIVPDPEPPVRRLVRVETDGFAASPPLVEDAVPVALDEEEASHAELLRREERAKELLERKMARLAKEIEEAKLREKLLAAQEKVRHRSMRGPSDFNLGAWLAGAGMADLRECSDSERQKVCATGYTVLVPTIFSLLSASYATSTLTSDPYIITLVALAWAFIILLVDRAIIATYSPNMSFWGKAGTIVIRFVVAALMGITVSHPLTLLIFKDTINARIEEERAVEISTAREKFAENKKSLEEKLAAAQIEVQKQQTLYQQSFDTKIDTQAGAVTAEVAAGSLTGEEQTLLSQRIETAAKPFQAELDDLDSLSRAGEARKIELQKELEHWRSQYEAELGGTRSGRSGEGPRSKAIMDTEITPRIAEQDRLATDLTAWTARRGELRKSISDSAESLREQMEAVARARGERARSENERLAGLQQQINEKKLNTMLSEGDNLRKVIQKGIDSAQAELDRQRRDLEELTAQELEVMNDLRTNPRRDMLSQSMALHHLFEHPELGGEVALVAYLVLAALFLAIDTMPILVKFTAKKGEFDQRRELAYKMAEIPAELRKPDENGAETLRRKALDLSLQEQQVQFYALQEKALHNEEKALGRKAMVHAKEKEAYEREREAMHAKADRDAALALKSLEIAERAQERQRELAEQERKAALAKQQAELERLELAAKEAEANEAKARAHLSRVQLEIAESDGGGFGELLLDGRGTVATQGLATVGDDGFNTRLAPAEGNLSADDAEARTS